MGIKHKFEKILAENPSAKFIVAEDVDVEAVKAETAANARLRAEHAPDAPPLVLPENAIGVFKGVPVFAVAPKAKSKVAP